MVGCNRLPELRALLHTIHVKKGSLCRLVIHREHVLQQEHGQGQLPFVKVSSPLSIKPLLPPTFSSPHPPPICCFFLSHAVITCPSLFDPANGEVQASDQSFGHVATYSCNEGYALIGDNSRRCQASARWSGEEPECLSKYHNVDWTSGVLQVENYVLWHLHTYIHCTHLCPFLQLSVGI